MNRAERRRIQKETKKRIKARQKKGYVSPKTPCQCKCGCTAPWRKPLVGETYRTPFYYCCSDCWQAWTNEHPNHGMKEAA